MPAFVPLLLLATGLAAAAMSAALIAAIRPMLLRFVLARPNARSSHKTPTPQGAGIGVIAATLLAAGGAIAFAADAGGNIPAIIFAATLVIALVGMIDDIGSIPVLPRLALQGLCAGAVLFALPAELRIVSALPVAIERLLLFLAILWFVNLVNFMDGLDLVTVAEIVPITLALAGLGWLGALPVNATLVAAALCGAALGFAPFNRPVAKIFLGDVGSLPIGLLVAWCLIELAGRGDLVAALLLPLYYLADATLTLLRRLANGERVWSAHRSHFYQRATDHGFTVCAVVSRIFVLNVLLAALAFASALTPSIPVQIALLVIGSFAVALLLVQFSRRRGTIF